MAALIVVNPAAGKGRAARVWRTARPILVGEGDWRCAATERPGHARALAASAATQGYERVVAVGGDGTVFEVANGLAGTSTALGIIPGGTGDDCARNLGIPRDPTAAARTALTGSARAVDLGRIQTAQGSSWFVNVAGFGFDAEAAWRANRLRTPVFLGGRLPYVIAVLQTLWRYGSPCMRISVDGCTLDKQVFVVAVANGASYGGGMRIAPDAVVDDGLFDVCVVGRISRLDVLRLVPKMYSGGHRGHPAVEFFRCRELCATATADARVRCQADGEPVGDAPARFTIHPAGLRCVTG